jgi:hypothetical protein
VWWFSFGKRRSQGKEVRKRHKGGGKERSKRRFKTFSRLGSAAFSNSLQREGIFAPKTCYIVSTAGILMPERERERERREGRKEIEKERRRREGGKKPRTGKEKRSSDDEGVEPFVVVVQFSRSFSFLVFSLFPLLQALSLSLSLSVPDSDPLSICFCWALVAKAACDLLLL